MTKNLKKLSDWYWKWGTQACWLYLAGDYTGGNKSLNIFAIYFRFFSVCWIEVYWAQRPTSEVFQSLRHESHLSLTYIGSREGACVQEMMLHCRSNELLHCSSVLWQRTIAWHKPSHWRWNKLKTTVRWRDCTIMLVSPCRCSQERGQRQPPVLNGSLSLHPLNEMEIISLSVMKAGPYP